MVLCHINSLQVCHRSLRFAVIAITQPGGFSYYTWLMESKQLVTMEGMVMLSKETIRIIKSTVPVLEIHGVNITKRFYQLLFLNHPELLHIFNHANQKQERQQTALANAVYAAAMHIDHLPAILPAVKQIAHKHRSIGIQAEHYPIVGKYLLVAIQDVLGEAATEEIIAAWSEAYKVIADVFIGMEAGMYEQSARQAGGWEGYRDFVVKRKVKESDVISSFYLVPRDGGPLAGFEPGQYVSVKLEIPGEEYTQIRQYSLSDAPGKPYYRISVKREEGHPDRPAGKVSVYLHRQVKEGDILRLSAPGGAFTLNREDPRPVVLISGGVGITPMMSMLNTLADTDPQRPVIFIHTAVNGNMHAMREEVKSLLPKLPHLSVYFCYTRPTDSDKTARVHHHEGYLNLPWMKTVIPTTDAQFYFCGPVSLMKTVYRALKTWGIPAADMHYEFFGPAGSLDDVAEPAGAGG